MPVSNFRQAFFITTVTYYTDGWQISYYEALKASGGTYSFTLKTAQPVYVQLDFYQARMYAEGCQTGSSGQVALLQNGSTIASVSANDEIGFGYIY